MPLGTQVALQRILPCRHRSQGGCDLGIVEDAVARSARTANSPVAQGETVASTLARRTISRANSNQVAEPVLTT